MRNPQRILAFCVFVYHWKKSGTPLPIALPIVSRSGSRPQAAVHPPGPAENVCVSSMISSDPAARVSVIASNPQTLERFVRMIRTYTRIEPEAAVLVTDPDAHVVVRDAELLIDSQSIHTQVMGWGPKGLVVTVRYQIEPTSVAYLREVLRRRGAVGLE